LLDGFDGLSDGRLFVFLNLLPGGFYECSVLISHDSCVFAVGRMD